MLIPHKGHTDTIQVYSVTVMTHVKALQAGHSSQGTSEPITPANGALRPPVSHKIVSRVRRPRRLKGVTTVARGPDIGGPPPAEMSSVQALMELALPRFAMPEEPRQVHRPWPVTSEPPASPAPSQIEPRGGVDSRCLMDQTSSSSVYFNLDALSSSSNEESVDVKKCRDLSVTILYQSEEVDRLAKSEIALSDNACPAVSEVGDIRQVIRRRDGPRGGSSRKSWWSDGGQEPSAPAVNLVTGKCKPGRVSRTVSSSPLTLDMTVVCTPDPDRLQPEVRSQKVLPADTVNESVTGFDTSTPLIATPAMLVGQKTPQVEDVPTLDRSESSDLLPSFGLSTSSSSSSSPTLPWGTADDSSPSFSPNVRERQSQSELNEGSLFNVSPLSPEVVVRPAREGGLTQPEGMLLPTMLDDFNDSVLGDPISYARIDQLPGSESPLSLPVYAWPPRPALMMDPVIQTVLAPRKSERLLAETSVTDSPVTGEKPRVITSGLPGCPYRLLEFGELPFTDGNPAYGLQLHHPCFLELVGAPESARLLDCAPSFWVGRTG